MAPLNKSKSCSSQCKSSDYVFLLVSWLLIEGLWYWILPLAHLPTVSHLLSKRLGRSRKYWLVWGISMIPKRKSFQVCWKHSQGDVAIPEEGGLCQILKLLQYLFPDQYLFSIHFPTYLGKRSCFSWHVRLFLAFWLLYIYCTIVLALHKKVHKMGHNAVCRGVAKVLERGSAGCWHCFSVQQRWTIIIWMGFFLLEVFDCSCLMLHWTILKLIRK